jgi:hypothetical protein
MAMISFSHDLLLQLQQIPDRIHARGAGLSCPVVDAELGAWSLGELALSESSQKE